MNNLMSQASQAEFKTHDDVPLARRGSKSTQADRNRHYQAFSDSAPLSEEQLRRLPAVYRNFA